MNKSDILYCIHCLRLTYWDEDDHRLSTNEPVILTHMLLKHGADNFEQHENDIRSYPKREYIEL